ncbi:MAG: N-formylglutamate amidohydrolase [Deltaproteobacteria bacterium]|nr:N-formylglutamate amidohydrolase [Deltaproteobacteria bacterium]
MIDLPGDPEEGSPPVSTTTATAIPYTTAPRPPLELVPVAENPRGLCPPAYRDRILVYTVHDGTTIPSFVLDNPAIAPLEARGELWPLYVRERDWGANLVAETLAYTLGLPGYYRVNVARVVLDFNRFPGSSAPEATPLDRMAVLHPFSALLSHQEKRRLLEEHYDPISEGMERALGNNLLFMAVHTYDQHNATQTQRPEISLLTRALSYQQASRLPYNTFDPLFPDILAESSAHPILRDRVALTLEKAGLDVEHNYPYCLPDGSLEVRSQPWLFFQAVRRLFLETHPETTDDPAFDLVWKMLLNTNLRVADAEALSGYLRRFRRPPLGQESRFEAAALAYDTVCTFLGDRSDFICNYRRSPNRTSALAVEIRKDLVWRFEDGEPIAGRPRNAEAIASTLASGIAEYFECDHQNSQDDVASSWSSSPENKLTSAS